MEKGKKKFLIIAILFLLIGISFATYSIYRSSKSGNGSLGTATWSVKLKGESIDDATKVFSFNYDDITWTTLTGKNNKIAPGSRGTITFEIDATGSEVDVDYTVSVGAITVGGSAAGTGLTVTPAATADGSGTISYSTASGAMKKTITLNVVWDGSNSDTDAKDTSDKAMAGKTITIPVTVTAKQHI